MKGLLLGYSSGSSTVRAYADAPRFHSFWKPNRERRSSGLACMRGQASRGVWYPSKAPAHSPNRLRCGHEDDNAKSGEEHTGRDMESRGKQARGGRGVRGGPFELAAEVVSAAAAAGDQLSESESDDDGESTAIPTPAAARTIFDAPPAAAVASAAAVQTENDGVALAHGDGNKCDMFDAGRGIEVCGHRNVYKVGGRGTQEVFERDLATAALVRARRSTRNRDASRLSDRMGGIAAKVGLAT